MSEVKRYAFRLSQPAVLMGSRLEVIEYSGDGLPYVLAADYDALRAENERLEAQRDAILQQARNWACEAKTQRSTVDAVGEILGGIPDWGPIAAGVEAMRAELAAIKWQQVHGDSHRPATAGLVELIEPAMHWAGSIRDAWPEDAEHPDWPWVVGAISDGEKYPVLTIDAYQYDADGDSEKIARATIKLWSAALEASPW